MGSAPPEYYLFKAADRLHVPPWELLERPDYILYKNWALSILSVENEVQAELHKRSQESMRRGVGR